MARPAQPIVVRFGVFAVNLRSGELHKHGLRVRLPNQAFKILAILLDRPGEVVTREELQELLWPGDTFVDFEHSLNSAIKKLREALSDSADHPRYIETLPRLGYRFVAPVERVAASFETLAAPEPAEIPLSITSHLVTHLEIQKTPAKWHRSLAWFLGIGAVVAMIAAVAVVSIAPRIRERISSAFHEPKEPAVASRAASAPGIGSPHSIAVLPLENLSSDPSQDYFADGMTDELTTDLAQFGNLRVISRTSAMHYKGTKETAPQIGRELGVDFLLEGTVQRVGERVRIRAQLIDSTSDRHLWAQSFDRDLSDILEMQSQAAREIAGQIQGTVIAPESAARAAYVRPVNAEAYEAYLKGRYFWDKRTPDGLMKSIGFYEQAIAKDSKFAPAYAGLADSYSLLGSDVLPAETASASARTAADKALELDPAIAEGHTALGLVEFYYDWDWKQAENEFRRAIALNPNYATAHQWYSYYLDAMGRFPEAVQEASRAQQLDPLSLSINATLAGRYAAARQYDKGVALARKTLEMDPNFTQAHIGLGSIYENQGLWPQAIDEYQKAVDLSHGSPAALTSLGHAYGASGNREEARKIAQRLAEMSKEQNVSSLEMAAVVISIGDRDGACELLERAYRRRESQIPFLNVDHRFDPLRSDPRFQDLVRRLDFPPAPG